MKVFLFAMIGMAVLDAIWTLWAIHSAEKKPWLAGMWSAQIVFIGTLITRHTIKNDFALVGASIGAFLGTAAIIIITKKLEKKDERKLS